MFSKLKKSLRSYLWTKANLFFLGETNTLIKSEIGKFKKEQECADQRLIEADTLKYAHEPVMIFLENKICIGVLIPRMWIPLKGQEILGSLEITDILTGKKYEFAPGYHRLNGFDPVVCHSLLNSPKALQAKALVGESFVFNPSTKHYYLSVLKNEFISKTDGWDERLEGFIKECEDLYIAKFADFVKSLRNNNLKYGQHSYYKNSGKVLNEYTHEKHIYGFMVSQNEIDKISENAAKLLDEKFLSEYFKANPGCPYEEEIVRCQETCIAQLVLIRLFKESLNDRYNF